MDLETGHLDNILLIVWLGTCDLTSYDGTFISLSADYNIVQHVTEQYQQITQLVQRYPACKLTFLETPPYSIINFNKHRGHVKPSTYKSQEEELLKNIHQLNEAIRYINSTINTFSPSLATDLSHRHTEAGSKSRKLYARDNYAFHLYADGIHPDEFLAKVWLKKIALHVQKECWR